MSVTSVLGWAAFAYVLLQGIRYLLGARVYLTCALREVEARTVGRQQLDPGELKLLGLLDHDLAATGFRHLGFGQVTPLVTYYDKPLTVSIFANDRLPGYALVRRALAPEYARLVELEIRTALASGEQIVTLNTSFSNAQSVPGFLMEGYPGLSATQLVERHRERVAAVSHTNVITFSEAPESAAGVSATANVESVLAQITADMREVRSLFRARKWILPTTDPSLDRFTLSGALALTRYSRGVFTRYRPTVGQSEATARAPRLDASPKVAPTMQESRAAAVAPTIEAQLTDARASGLEVRPTAAEKPPEAQPAAAAGSSAKMQAAAVVWPSPEAQPAAPAGSALATDAISASFAGDETSLRVEADLQVILQAAEHPESAPGTPWPLLIVIAATAILSFIAMAALWNGYVAALILAAIAFHEAGHALAMRLCGYRDIHIFFVPLLGAMTVARPAVTTVRDRLAVLLAGPLPGLWLAVVLLALDQTYGPVRLLRAAALTLLILNGLNLLPITPLDGGRALEALTRPESLWRIVVHAASAAGLLILAAFAKDPLIVAVGFAWAAILPRQILTYRLRRAVADGVNNREDFRGVARTALEVMTTPRYARWNAATRQVAARAIGRQFAESLATSADRRWGALAYASAWIPVVAALWLMRS